ncbi:MAG: hypothetical protein ABH858_07615, partial [Candidatus Omnitrophota bacterium]
ISSLNIIYKMINIVGIDPRRFIKIIVFPLIAAIAMGVATFAIKNYIFDDINILCFFLLCIIALLIYVLIISLLDVFFHCDAGQFMRQQFAVLLQGLGNKAFRPDND